MNGIRKTISWVLSALALAGCQQDQKQIPAQREILARRPVEARVLHASARCGGETASATLLQADTAVPVPLLQDRMPSDGTGLPLQVPPGTSALWIAMGLQPSSGYELDLGSGGASAVGDTLIVSVKWQEPMADRHYAQVITFPCMVLALQQGRFRSVRVVDEEGVVRIDSILDPR
jgi:hypothetical protein